MNPLRTKGVAAIVVLCLLIIAGALFTNSKHKAPAPDLASSTVTSESPGTVAEVPSASAPADESEQPMPTTIAIAAEKSVWKLTPVAPAASQEPPAPRRSPASRRRACC